jgi:heptosyltransferase-1
MHLTAAAGAPIVALLGPTDPARNGPWHPDDEAVSRYDRCECRYRRRCARPSPCIDDITVEEVVAACERRLDRV